MFKSIKVEAEHNELILKNSYGDIIIVPAKLRLKVKEYIAQSCNHCIDRVAEKLPSIKGGKADKGAIIDIDPIKPKPVFQNSPAGLMIPEVDIVAEKPAWQQYKEDYEIENPKKDYINNYLTPFARGVGNNEEHYPSRLDREYEDLALDYSGNKLAEANPQGDRNRGEWLDSMDEKDEELIKRNPKYQSTLYADTKRGFQSLLSNPVDAVSSVVDETGFSRREKANIIKQHLDHPYISKLADAGDLMSVLDVPAKAVQSVYKRDYTLGDAVMGKKNDAGFVEDVATDALAGLLTGGASAAGKVAGKAGVKAGKAVGEAGIRAGKAVGEASVKAGKAIGESGEKIVDGVKNIFKKKKDSRTVIGNYDRYTYDPMRHIEIDQTTPHNPRPPKPPDPPKNIPSENITPPKLIVGSIDDNGYLSRVARGKQGVNQTITPDDIEKLQSRADATKGDKYITKKVLDEKFAGKKEINYEKFKEEVMNELAPLDKEEVKRHADYGLDKIGYNANAKEFEPINESIEYYEGRVQFLENLLNDSKKKEKIISDELINTPPTVKKESSFGRISYQFDNFHYNTMNEVEEAKSVWLEDKQRVLESIKNKIKRQSKDISEIKVKLKDNKEKLSRISTNGFIENNTILFNNEKDLNVSESIHFTQPNVFHTRYFTSYKEPNIFHILESQSDHFQSKQAKMKFPFTTDKEEILKIKNKRDAQFLENINLNSKDIMHYEKLLKEAKIKIKNIKNLNEEEVKYLNGSIQHYEREILYHEKHISLNREKIKDPVIINNQLGALYDKHQDRILQENVAFAADKGKTIIRYPTAETAAKIQKYPTIENPSPEFSINNFELERQVILKKYEAIPKLISKNLNIKKDDIRTVTDHLGNSWFEFDIPKSFLEGKGKIKAFTTLPVGAAAAIEGARNGEKKVEN